MKDKNCKILLVSYAFYPEISPRSYRATELAKEFIRQGHKVTVITKYRHHDYSDFIKAYPVDLKMWKQEVLPRIPVIKRKPFSYIFRAFSRILSVLFEYPIIEEMFHVKDMLKSENDYDIMISFAVPYPVHWGVAWSRTPRHQIARLWIADCGDPFMGDVLDSFRKPFYFKYMEKWFCRKTDFITIPIESARSAYYSEFHHKIRVIPQGFDFDMDVKNSKQLLNEVPNFAYAGGFIPGVRDPFPLLNFLVNINKPFKFLIFTNKSDLFNEYHTLLNGKLEIYNYIPRSELMGILSGMDFLINFDNNTLFNSPSKLIDYAIANRPILNIKQRFNPEDLLAFLDGDYSNRMELPGREQYHIKNISQKFISLMQDKDII